MFCLMHQRGHFLAKQVVYPQRHVADCWQLIACRRCRIERVGIVLVRCVCYRDSDSSVTAVVEYTKEFPYIAL